MRPQLACVDDIPIGYCLVGPFVQCGREVVG